MNNTGQNLVMITFNLNEKKTGLVRFKFYKTDEIPQ